MLLCDNETNAVALFGAERNPTDYRKDGINRRVVHGDRTAVNPAGTGTKAAFWYVFDAVGPGEWVEVRLRLSTAADRRTHLRRRFHGRAGRPRRRGRRLLRQRVCPTRRPTRTRPSRGAPSPG